MRLTPQRIVFSRTPSEVYAPPPQSSFSNGADLQSHGPQFTVTLIDTVWFRLPLLACTVTVPVWGCGMDCCWPLVLPLPPPQETVASSTQSMNRPSAL